MKRMPWVFVLGLAMTTPALGAQVLRGAEARVSDQGGDIHSTLDLAVHDDGRFVAVWSVPEGLGYRVLIRLFDASSRPLTLAFPVANPAHGFQRSPRVAMDPTGGFVVVWETGRQVWGRRFDAAGKPLGRRFALDDEVGEGQITPEVGIAPDGRLLVAWAEQNGLDPELCPHFGLWARWLAPDGSPLAPPFLVSDEFWQNDTPRIAFNRAGGIAIAFQGWVDEGDFYDVFLVRYWATGAPRGPRIPVNVDVEAMQFDPAVVLADDGRSLVVWTDSAGDLLEDAGLPFLDIGGVRARLFRVDGTPAGPSFAVNRRTTASQEAPSVALTPDGGFLIAWTSGGSQDGHGQGIFAHSFGPNGEPRGREFRINLGRAGNQFAPSLALARSGRGVALWTSQPSNGTGEAGLFARRFEPR